MASSSEPSSAPPTTGGLVTVGPETSSEPSVGSGLAGTEAEGALGSALGITTTLVADSSEDGGSREQVGDTVTVLVAVSVTVTGWQDDSSGGVMGPAPWQSPSRMENLGVWAWMTKTLVPLMALLGVGLTWVHEEQG